MEAILRQYNLLSREKEIAAFIGKHTEIWVVLQDLYPHLVKVYGRRKVSLKLDSKAQQLRVLLHVAYPPQTLRECRELLTKTYLSTVPEKVLKYFSIDKADNS